MKFLVNEKCYAGNIASKLRSIFKMRSNPNLVLGALTPIVDIGDVSGVEWITSTVDSSVGHNVLFIASKRMVIYALRVRLVPTGVGNTMSDLWYVNKNGSALIKLREFVPSVEETHLGTTNLGYPVVLDEGVGIDVVQDAGAACVAWYYLLCSVQAV